MVGGWRDRFAETGAIVRPLAVSMAGTHLRAGRDVVLPQFLGRLREIERFEAVARDSGAEFREVVLMDTRDRCLERFARRDDDLPWVRQIRRHVAEQGGDAHLAAVYDALVDVVRRRPTATVLTSEADAVERTYQDLLAVL